MEIQLQETILQMQMEVQSVEEAKHHQRLWLDYLILSRYCIYNYKRLTKYNFKGRQTSWIPIHS